MKKSVLLIASILLFSGITVSAEEPHHTRWWEVQGWESEEEINEQIEQEIKEGEMEMLAQLIEAEAGNQYYRGKCLVADVVLNRVQSDIFPDTVEEVIFQMLNNGVHQFSTIQDGAFDEAGWYISEDSFKAAKQEYEASKRIDSKIHYFTAGEYNKYCIPAYKYGDHYFGY